LKGGGSLWTQISGGKGRPPPTIFGTRKVESLGYRMLKKTLPKSLTAWVGCTNVTDDRKTTDRQTDGIAIACSERNVVTFAKNQGFASHKCCRAHLCDQHTAILTDRHTNTKTTLRVTSVAIGRICYVCDAAQKLKPGLVASYPAWKRNVSILKEEVNK